MPSGNFGRRSFPQLPLKVKATEDVIWLVATDADALLAQAGDINQETQKLIDATPGLPLQQDHPQSGRESRLATKDKFRVASLGCIKPEKTTRPTKTYTL